MAIVRKRNAQRVIRWGKSNSEGLVLPKGWGFSYQRKPGPSSAAGVIVLKCWVWGRQVGLYGLRDVSAVDTTAHGLQATTPRPSLDSEFTKTRGQSTPRESRWLTGSEQAHRRAGGCGGD